MYWFISARSRGCIPYPGTVMRYKNQRTRQVYSKEKAGAESSGGIYLIIIGAAIAAAAFFTAGGREEPNGESGTAAQTACPL